MKDRLSGLYVIIDPEVARGRDEAEIAREAIAGGARMIQLRDKTRAEAAQLPIAKRLADICRGNNVAFFVNDNVDLSLASGADGVHLGQTDHPLAAVRKRVGSDLLIGASTNNVEEALQAEADGADYVSVGRLFSTGSKADTRPATLDTLRVIKAAVSVPVCAIGGINESNIDGVINAGADIVSVIAAVVSAPDIREAAQTLASRFEN
ncbi:MAG: thiamine phosphate synthase [Chloroflexi bacterium]|nr:thiamine phosphate synthase [Chloroflexota bacterium]